jgi:hypothetical protein
MWWLPQTSGYSYLRVAAIRIDVHHVGENPTNTPRTLPTPIHIHLAYASYEQSPYVTTFHESSIELSRPAAPEKKGSWHNSQRVADRSTGPYPTSLPSQLMKQWGQSQASINGRLLGLLSPYHKYAIGMFNTCSRGATYRSLTDTGGGYNLEGASFLRTTPRPSRPAVSPFHIRAPPGLQFNQVSTTKPKCLVLKNIWLPCDLLTTRSSTVAYIYT